MAARENACTYHFLREAYEWAGSSHELLCDDFLSGRDASPSVSKVDWPCAFPMVIRYYMYTEIDYATHQYKQLFLWRDQVLKISQKFKGLEFQYCTVLEFNAKTGGVKAICASKICRLRCDNDGEIKKNASIFFK